MTASTPAPSTIGPQEIEILPAPSICFCLAAAALLGSKTVAALPPPAAGMALASKVLPQPGQRSFFPTSSSRTRSCLLHLGQETVIGIVTNPAALQHADTRSKTSHQPR